MIISIDLNGISWAKSSRSGGSNACVEVAAVDGGVTENR